MQYDHVVDRISCDVGWLLLGSTAGYPITPTGNEMLVLAG